MKLMFQRTVCNSHAFLPPEEHLLKWTPLYYSEILYHSNEHCLASTVKMKMIQLDTFTKGIVPSFILRIELILSIINDLVGGWYVCI